jgi:Cu/Ag efflux pump CusA
VTKTFAMAAASDALGDARAGAMGLFVRGRIRRERANPINRALIRTYRPVIRVVLRHRWPVIVAAAVVLILTWIPFQRIGSEFMPPLEEGTILYMPTTLPGISVARASEICGSRTPSWRRSRRWSTSGARRGGPRRRPTRRARHVRDHHHAEAGSRSGARA